MKKSKIFFLLCAILTTFTIFVILDSQKNITFVSADQSAEVVIERDSLRVLTGANIDEKMPMASTTKILTAITVLENANLKDRVTITKESVGIEGSSIYLKEGEVLTVEELLYGMMMRSGNDAAHALAIHVAKSIEKFAQLMNSVALKCGAINSNFVNPHGLSDINHYTTAKDLALITCYALKNEQFQKIVSTKSITFNDRTFANKNKMLNLYEGADGVKTGYTKNAGRCLVTSATKKGMQLVSVVLNCGPMYERSEELLDYCFDNFKPTCVLKQDEILAEIPIKDSVIIDEKFPVRLCKDLIIPLKEGEINSIGVEFIPVEYLDFPVNKGTYVGNLSIYTDKDLIFSSKLFTIFTDDEHGFVETLNGVFARWRVYAN